MGNKLEVDPKRLKAAAAKMDVLAARLDKALVTHAPALNVPAGGRDEVSTTVAHSVNTAGEAFKTDGKTGAYELRKIAAVFRLQATGYDKSELNNQAIFKA